jgi:hypothetical protein
MHQVHASIIIPQGARINQPFAGLDQNGFDQARSGSFGFNHVYAMIGIPVKYVVETPGDTDTRCPNSTAQLGF